MKSIGAEDLVDFRIKPPPCTGHWQRHARDAGLSDMVDNIDEIADFLLKDSKITFSEKSDGLTEFHLSHPLINPTQVGELDPSTIADIEGPLSRKAAVLIARRFVAHLTSDVTASNTYGAALGSVNKIHDILLREWRGVTVEDVLMKLNLPVLDGLQPWDLIDIRREESQYFAGFRNSLLVAIRERIKVSGDTSAITLAEEIRLDVIQPELSRIETRLKAAQSAMSRKSAVGLVLGTLSTTCGILAGLTPEVATLTGSAVAISCAGAATGKYLDDVKDVSLSNMFFLWRAQEHTPH